MADESQADNEFLSVSLTSGQLRTLLDSLDVASARTPHTERRSRRLKFRSVRVRIQLVDRSGGDGVVFRVPTRNISAHGLAFVHRQMIAPDQLLRIEIPLLDDQILATTARVVRCRHLEGMLHEIGVEFVKSTVDCAAVTADAPQVVRR